MKRLILIAFLFLSFVSQAQVKFKQVYGGKDQDYAYSGVQTYDRGYAMVGTTSSFGLSNKNIYLIKTDSFGVKQWSNVFYTGIKGLSIKQTLDSGYVIAGFADGFSSDYDMNIIKTDKNGIFLWVKYYGGNDWDFANSISQTSDGGFIIAGGTYSYGAGNEDFYLVKTDSNGDTLWTKTYGSIAEEEAKSVKQTADGGYILIGSTKKNASTSKSDIWCVKTNSTGDTLWTKTFSNPDNDYGADIIQTADGGYAISATTFNVANNMNQAYIIKTDANGLTQTATEWASIWQGPTLVYYDTYAGAIAQDDAGDLIFTGYQRTGGTLEMIIYKISLVGAYKNGTTYGTQTGDEYGYFLQQTHDKGFVLGGTTNGIGNGMNDILLVKVDSNLVYAGPFVVGINENTKTNHQLSVFPNPASATIHIKFPLVNENEEPLIELFTIYGTKIVETQKSNENLSQHHFFETNLNVKDLKAGVYLLKITQGNHILSSKIIVQH